MGKLINPTTGRWVSRSGRIGKQLIRMNCVITNKKKYLKVVSLWDWWATRDDAHRQQVANIWWDTKLNDMEVGKYPFYIMDYEQVLTKAKTVSKHKWLWNELLKH